MLKVPLLVSCAWYYTLRPAVVTYLTYCHGNADARIGSFTRLLHAERCWVISAAWWMSMSRCLQSSFTMSIYLFLGLSCLLFPCTYLWSASFGYLVWSIFCTWPKYCIRRCCMRFATSWSRPTLSHTSLLLILSLRVTPAVLLKQDILNTHNLFFCVCFNVQPAVVWSEITFWR